VTLLVREIGRFLAGAAVWVVALVVIAGIASLAVGWVRRRGTDLRTLGASITIGAGVAAAAHRIGIADTWAPRLAGRELPVLWILLGAAATTALLLRGDASRP